MSSYSGYMNIYNGYGSTITTVTAVHTTGNGITQQLTIGSLAQGAVATAVSIEAFSDESDSWSLSFTDKDSNTRSVDFSDAGFKSEDATGTVIFNISEMGVKLCFPKSDDNYSDY